MIQTTTPASGVAASYDIRVTLTSDWHVGTGVGLPGGADALVIRDGSKRPYLPATAVTGLFGDAAAVVARALDAGAEGRTWEDFRISLFGFDRTPARIRFASAEVAGGDVFAVAERPNVKIDERTGRAADDMLRLTETTGRTTLVSSVVLLAEDSSGWTLPWTDEQLAAARVLIGAAAGLVDRVGAGRHRGLGRCTTRLLENGVGDTLLDPGRCVEKASERAPSAPTAVAPARGAPAPSRRAAQPAAAWRSHTFELILRTPLLAQSGTFGNVIETYDHVPGTMLMAWVHRELRRRFPDSDRVRDAVVANELIVTAALPVRDGVRAIPVPFAYLEPKIKNSKAPYPVRNVLRPAAPDESTEPHKPMRSGFVGAADDTGVVAYLKVKPITRMHNSFDPLHRRAAESQLYTVRLIPPDTKLGFEVLLSQGLAEEIGDLTLPESARLGGKSAKYGLVEVRPGVRPDPAPPNIAPGELTIMFTSDLVLRDRRFRPAGPDELITRLRAAGIGVRSGEVVPDVPDNVTRSRRVDGWYSRGAAARPSLVTVQAGTSRRLRWDGTGEQVLRDLLVTGVGERRAEGFGRFVINPDILARRTIMLIEPKESP